MEKMLPSLVRHQHYVERSAELMEFAKKHGGGFYYDPSWDIGLLSIFPMGKVEMSSLEEWNDFYKKLLANVNCQAFLDKVTLSDYSMYISNFEFEMLNDFVLALNNLGVLKSVVYKCSKSRFANKPNVSFHFVLDEDKVFDLLVAKKHQTKENREFFDKHTCNRFSVFFGDGTLRNKGNPEDPLKLYFKIFSMKNKKKIDRNVLTSYNWEKMLKEDNIELKTKNHHQHFLIRLYESFFDEAYCDEKEEIFRKKIHELYEEQNYDC